MGGAILIIQNLKFGLVFGQLGCLEYTLVYLTWPLKDRKKGLSLGPPRGNFCEKEA